jgi:hypothetical protein
MEVGKEVFEVGTPLCYHEKRYHETEVVRFENLLAHVGGHEKALETFDDGVLVAFVEVDEKRGDPLGPLGSHPLFCCLQDPMDYVDLEILAVLEDPEVVEVDASRGIEAVDPGVDPVIDPGDVVDPGANHYSSRDSYE